MNSILPNGSSWKLVMASVLIIVVVGLVGYANTWLVPMVFDDFTSIMTNPAVLNLDVARIWSQYPTRFVTYLTLTANYAISGLEVWSYHLVNILIHLSTALAVGWLVLQLSVRTRKSRYYQVRSLRVSNHLLLAVLTALLFVSHPIQTQAVTYIIQRLASLATFLYILGLALYVKGRNEGSSKWWLVSSGVVVVLAMFSKEIAFTAPLAVLLIEFLFFSVKQSVRRRVIMTLPFLLTLVIIPMVLFVTRVEVPVAINNPEGVIVGSLDKVSFAGITSDTKEITRGQYFLTELNVIRTYLRLLVLPVNQNLDYDYPIATGWSGSVVLSGLLIVVILGLGIVLLRFNRLVAFGIFFFFLALLVESSVIPISDVIFEHRLYLPSVGFFLAVSAGVVFVMDRWALKTKGEFYVALVLMSVLIVTMTVATWRRNAVWQNEETLWRDVVAKSPNKARGYGNLAVIYMRRGELDRSLEELQRAEELDSSLPGLYFNFGNLHRLEGRLDEAVSAYLREIVLYPKNINTYINLAGVGLQRGNFDKAKRSLERALGYNSDLAVIWTNLGVLYAKLDQSKNSIEAFKRALEIDSNFEQAKQGLKIMQTEP